MGLNHNILHQPGNKHLSDLILIHHLSYKQISQYNWKEKNRIASTVVNEIHQVGGRFLERDVCSAMWCHIDLSTAQKSVALRLKRSKAGNINHNSKVKVTPQAAISSHHASLQSNPSSKEIDEDDDNKMMATSVHPNNVWSILEALKSKGVWLLDTAIFGWYIAQKQEYTTSKVSGDVQRKPKSLVLPKFLRTQSLFYHRNYL